MEGWPVKMFLSAAEIAALALPGLPGTKRGVLFVAERSEWISRPRNARGGGLEYAVESLPIKARIAYIGQHIDTIEVPASMARDAAAEPDAIDVKGSAASARDARLAILGLADKVAASAGVGHKRSDRHFCDLYNAPPGALDVADWIRAEVKHLAPRTLARWRSLAKAGRKSRLAVNRAAARKGTGILDRACDGAVKTYILALIAKQPQLTAHHIRREVADRFPVIWLPREKSDRSTEGRAGLRNGDAGGAITQRPANPTLYDRDRFPPAAGIKPGRSDTIPLPPVRTFQHTLKAWNAAYRVELESIRNPDRFKSAMRFAARVAVPATRVNEVWQIDASPADVMTTDGRASVYACIDIYSRRMIGFVSRTPRAAAVGQLVRKAMLTWGTPERIKTDNGSDFIAHQTKRLFAALDIEIELAPPFSPEKKGHVERSIKTLQHGLMRTLPGFVGHNVADRQVIRNRKTFADRLGEKTDDLFQVELSAAELQTRVDEWCKDVYGNTPHASLKGRTPFAVAATNATTLRRIEDVRALDVLLAPIAGKDGIRTVTKTGLRVGGAHYMAGWMNVGDRVLVRMDEADMGRVFVFSADGETYLGDAIAPDLAGVDPAAFIAAARADQRRRIAEKIGEAKRVKLKPGEFAAAQRRQALREAGTLIEFPKPTAPHSTPALTAASAAARGNEIVPQHAPDVLALQASLLAGETPAVVTSLRVEETPHQRWNRAREIEARVARGEFVDAETLMWLGGYREGSEYRGFARTYGVSLEEKGPVAAGPGSQF